jgi:hypothetical protein
MTPTLIVIHHRVIDGRSFRHGAELPPGTLTREEVSRLLDQGVLREYSERRSLYRLLPAFSGATEHEEVSDSELAAYTLAEPRGKVGIPTSRPPEASRGTSTETSVDLRALKKGQAVFIINRAVPMSDTPATFEQMVDDEFALVTAYGEQRKVALADLRLPIRFGWR